MSSKLDNPVDELFEEPPSSLLSFIVGFYFAFRVVTVLFLARVFDADPRTGTAVNLAADYFLLLLSAFCSVESRYPFGEMARLPGVRWALLFLGFSFCSLLWSRTASLPDSVAYWCGMASDFAIVVLLLRSGETERVSRSLMKGFVWGACAVAAVAWVLPAQSDLRLGDEELLGPNQIGYVCAFAFFFAAIANLLVKSFGRAGRQSLPSLEALPGENPSPPQLPVNEADSTAAARVVSRADRCFGKKILKREPSDSGWIRLVEYRSASPRAQSSRTFYQDVASVLGFR